MDRRNRWSSMTVPLLILVLPILAACAGGPQAAAPSPAQVAAATAAPAPTAIIAPATAAPATASGLNKIITL
jgi:hypothetical protein